MTPQTTLLSMKPTFHLRSTLRALMLLGACALGSGALAASITWNAPATITADTDVKNLGGLVYAYTESNASATVNGVIFAAGSSASNLGAGNITISGLTSVNNTTFSNPTGLSTAYANLTKGATYVNGATPATVTLNNLSVGHLYLPQVWVNDSRAGTSRNETVTSAGGNTINLNYNTTSAAGGAGQYTIGSFTANAASQAFTLTGNASTQLNAIQLRDVTGVWSGAANANLDNASANFTGGNSYDALAGMAAPVTDLYFADTDGLLNPVVNTGLAVQAGGFSTGSLNFQNSALSYTLTSADANGISGSTALNVLGPGTVTLLGAHAYLGPTGISAGTLQLGDGVTDASLTGGGAIGISAGAFLKANVVVSQTLSVPVSGAGTMVKSGSGILLFDSASTDNVATTLDGGTLRFTADQTGLKALTFGAADLSTSISTLDLSTTPSNLTATSLSVRTNNATANTITIGDAKTLTISGAVNIGATSGTTRLTMTGATGTLAINNGGGATNANFGIGGGGTSAATLDLSGLGTFNANLGTGTLAVGMGSTNTNNALPNTLLLAANSSITATRVSVGAGFLNTTNASVYTMRLGSGTNVINTPDLYIGVYNNQGRGNTGTTLNFNTTTGTLTLRGLTGGTSRANVHIGENQGGSTGTGSGGSFNLGGSTSTSLSGGNADLLINNLIISRRTAGSNDASSMTFRGGTLDVNNVTMGNSTGGNSATGTLTLNGGTVVFNTSVTLGLSSSSGTGNATLNIAGASVTATPGIIMGNRTSGTVNSTVNITGGSLALGGDITMTGASVSTLTLNGAAALLNMQGHHIGTLAAPIGAFNFTNGTLQDVGTVFGPVTLAAGTHTIHQNANAGEIQGVIGGGAFGITKTGTQTLTLSGANTYSGGTAVQNGTLVVAAGGTLGAATSAVSLGSGVAGTLGTVGHLTLGTGASVGALSVISNTSDTTTPANIAQLTIPAGQTLTATSFTSGVAANASGSTNTAMGTGAVPGAGGTLTVNGNVAVGTAITADTSSGTTVVDLSGLDTFNATSTAGFLRVGYGWNNKAGLTLAANNTINVGTLSIADSNNQNYSGAGSSTLKLGTGTNALQTPALIIGASKGAGVVSFAGATGEVTITGANGVGTANITVGNAFSATYMGVGTNGLLLAGHNASVAAGTVVIAQRNGSTSAAQPVAQITFDTGTFTADSITLASDLGGANTSTTLNGSFVLGSSPASTGVLTVNTAFHLARNTNPTVTDTVTGAFIINGGTAILNTDLKDISTRGTSNTTLTLDGGTLDMTGHAIGGNSSGNLAIDNLNFRSGTLKNVGLINVTGGLSKTTDGVLTLGGNNTFTGDVRIVTASGGGGDILATHSGSFGIGPKTVYALGNTGANRPTLILDGSAGDLSFAGNINFRTSNDSIADPAILSTVGNNRIQGALQLDSGGGNSAVVVNGGTLELGAVSSVIASARTLILGGPASGSVSGTISNGSSTVSLQKAGAGTWTLAGNNSYTGITTVTSGTLLVDGVHTGAGLVTVSAGATLGGGGTLVQVDVADGGILSPGSSAGHLTLSDLTLHPASVLDFELDAPSLVQNPNSDFVTLTSSLTLDGVLNITPLAGFGSPTLGDQWLLMTSAGGIINNGVNIGTSPPLASGLFFEVNVSNGENVFLTVVPEPAVGVLFALALLVLRRRFR